MGEGLYGHLTGEPVNLRIEIRDGGVDFPGVDVKASASWRDPWLKLQLGKKLVADFYYLVAVELETWRVRPAGFATRSMVANAPIMNLQHGPSRVLREPELLWSGWWPKR